MDGFIRLDRDPAIERVSRLLTPSREPPGFRTQLLLKSTRIAADVTVIRSAMLTLVIVESTMPVLPGHSKLVAAATGMVAATSLVAASIDLIVQIGPFTPGGILSGMPDEALADTADQLDKLMDPLGTAMEKILDYLGKLGLLDAERAKLAKELKSFVDAREAARNATKQSERVLQGLAAMEAAKKFFEKFQQEARRKIAEEQERQKNEAIRREREGLLNQQEPLYPNGIDYPNQPNNGAPPGGGTQIA